MSNVEVGGLSGKTMTIAIAPDAVVPTGDCPVQRCLGLFSGQGSTWGWDWGVADSEQQRVFALDSKDGVVLVFVESLDGTTVDSMSKAADTILQDGQVRPVGSTYPEAVSRPWSRPALARLSPRRPGHSPRI